jgi:hypothetical protein
MGKAQFREAQTLHGHFVPHDSQRGVEAFEVLQRKDNNIPIPRTRHDDRIVFIDDPLVIGRKVLAISLNVGSLHLMYLFEYKSTRIVSVVKVRVRIFALPEECGIACF